MDGKEYPVVFELGTIDCQGAGWGRAVGSAGSWTLKFPTNGRGDYEGYIYVNLPITNDFAGGRGDLFACGGDTFPDPYSIWEDD